MPQQELPSSKDIRWAILSALKEKGGSASNQELSESIARLLDLSQAVQDIPHKNRSISEVDYRGQWARTYLKIAGAIDNSARGIWTITDYGRRLSSADEMEQQVQQAVKKQRRSRQTSRIQAEKHSTDKDLDDNQENDDWYEELLSLLKTLDPSAFERLCQRVLRESGFTKLEVTGKSGDGGIDGAGVLRVNLLSFHVRFQSKRYAGSVGAGDIRDFRGAMVGRADKGLFMTTGRFTEAAQAEATRDGAPAIDLIDGFHFCDLLKQFGLGVRCQRVEKISIAPEFFAEL